MMTNISSMKISKDELVLELKGKEITAANAAVLTLIQIAKPFTETAKSEVIHKNLMHWRILLNPLMVIRSYLPTGSNTILKESKNDWIHSAIVYQELNTSQSIDNWNKGKLQVGFNSSGLCRAWT